MISPLGLTKTKQEFFFVSSSVRFFAYAWTMILRLWLRRSLCCRLDFIPLFCLLFCPYAHVRTRPNPRAELKTKQRKILVSFSQVPEEMSCFVFLLILSSCLCCSCEPDFNLKCGIFFIVLSFLFAFALYPRLCFCSRRSIYRCYRFKTSDRDPYEYQRTNNNHRTN